MNKLLDVKTGGAFRALVLVGVVMAAPRLWSGVVFQATSPYHHVRVVDRQGVRILSFDGTMETRMSLQNPLAGHFSYIEFFHVPLLMKPDATKVLTIGLGGGSVQRAYQAYHPQVEVHTVELDPVVVQVAKTYFGVTDTPKHRIRVGDGRVYLRRTQETYDAIVMDAYSKSRYGSFIPYHLATKEFFELASERMSDDGVLAYNVMGTMAGWQANVLGAMYKTMKSVFPHVYIFPASDSLNVVLIATKSDEALTLPQLQKRVIELTQKGRMRVPGMLQRIASFQTQAPPAAAGSKVLTDDFAPVDGLLSSAGSRAAQRE